VQHRICVTIDQTRRNACTADSVMCYFRQFLRIAIKSKYFVLALSCLFLFCRGTTTRKVTVVRTTFVHVAGFYTRFDWLSPQKSALGHVESRNGNHSLPFPLSFIKIKNSKIITVDWHTNFVIHIIRLCCVHVTYEAWLL
jgi:hypothetical protein